VKSAFLMLVVFLDILMVMDYFELYYINLIIYL